MYHEIHRMSREGHSIQSIADYLVINWRTVKKILSMNEQSYEDFVSQTTRDKELVQYESFIKYKLEQYQSTSAAQMHDWLKEHYIDFPSVASKTVYNFVMWVRQKYHLPKIKHERDYFIVEDLPFGKQAQVDFGQYSLRTGGGLRKKVYFFTFVLSRSRMKFVQFSDVPFTSSLAVLAHEKAFEYIQGLPQEIVYDQDKVFLHDENNGDLLLTDGFKKYVSSRSFQLHFCRKADPESKGKIENVVKYIKQNFLYNRPYVDIETLNSEASAWLSRTANYVPHARTKISPQSAWMEEKSSLKPFTPQQYSFDEKRVYYLRKDNSISYKSCMYSVPQGTWKSPETKVLVSEENGFVVIKDLRETEICRHQKSELKGKTIVNNNHKRDTSHKITELLQSEAKRFIDPVKALQYFEKIRESKSRYTRDQVTAICSCFEKFSSQTMNQTLDFCVEHGILNAHNFSSVAQRIEQETKASEIKTPSIKTLANCSQSADELIPNTSQIDVYEQIMLN
jgi:hypothetical protein